MKEYSLMRTAEPVDWTKIPAASMDMTYLQTPNSVKAWAQLALGEDALLLHLWLQTASVRAVEKGPLGMPCEDSCLEFFFQPVPDDPRYLNFEFNWNACLYLGIGTGIHDLIRLVPDDMEQLFCPVTRTIEGGWEIFYRIPHRFVRRLFPEYRPEKLTRGNFYACSDLSEPAYYLSWNPVEGETLSFHRPECFGKMITTNVN